MVVAVLRAKIVQEIPAPNARTQIIRPALTKISAVVSFIYLASQTILTPLPYLLIQQPEIHAIDPPTTLRAVPNPASVRSPPRRLHPQQQAPLPRQPLALPPHLYLSNQVQLLHLL